MIAVLKFATINGTKVVLPFDKVLVIEQAFDSPTTKIALDSGLAYSTKMSTEEIMTDALTFVGSVEDE